MPAQLTLITYFKLLHVYQFSRGEIDKIIQKIQENKKIGKKNIPIILFTNKDDTWSMWLRKVIKIYVSKGYDKIFTGDKKIPENETDKTKDEAVSEITLLNKTA